MMLSVTMGVSAEVLDSALSGGNPINNSVKHMLFNCILMAFLIIFSGVSVESDEKCE